MKGGPNIARIGALVGDPARATMLTALMNGGALTAGELAREAGVTVQTASTHLARLEQGGLLQLRKQGRHKYFSLASGEVARVLEGMMGLAAGAAKPRYLVGPKDLALRNARVCYSHLAGDMGVRLYDGLLNVGYLLADDQQLALSAAGRARMAKFGIPVDALRRAKAPLCRPCLDWSERKSHLAGSLGRALFSRMETLRWIKKDPQSRVVTFSRRGLDGFRELLR